MICLLLLLLTQTFLGASAQTFLASRFRTTLQDPLALYGEKFPSVYVSQTSSHIHLCFNKFHGDESRFDCISLTGKPEKKVVVKKEHGNFQLATEFKSKFGTVSSSLKSKTSLKLTLDSNEEVKILINSKEVTKTNTGKDFTFNLSGCKSKDGSRMKLSEEKKLQDCKKELCKTPGNSVEQSCAESDVCISDSCVYKATCTFTGPSIIDYKGVVGAIEDRCDYHLLAATQLSDFSVEGKFKDRRRKDKYFLDTVVLKHSTDTWKMKQGGIVMAGDNPVALTLNTPKASGVITFTKSDEGVTAKYSDNNKDVVVFFNGYTAQIDITGPPKTKLDLKHLCANAKSPVSDVRASTGSCETKHTDKKDPAIKCDEVKKSCQLLSNDPFTSCHGHVSPTAFVQACSDTMCSYPAVDGLTCYFLEAYSRACSLYNPSGVTGWRSKAKCPTAAKALCQDKPCGSEEFCGQMKDSMEWRCLCRPVHIQTFRDLKSLGNTTTCKGGSATASLFNCLLLEEGIDYKTLQLNDKNCDGKLVDGEVVFKFDSTNTCGAKVTNNNGGVKYENTIQTKDLPDDAILRTNPVEISMACDFTAPKLQLMSFKVTGGSSVVNKPMKSGNFDYQMSMKAFSDEARTQDLKSVQLNQRIWIELKATGVDEKLSAVLFDSCWATKQKEPETEPKYYLVNNGCKQDNTVALVGNGAGLLSVFSFQTFQFPKGGSEVFLHCKVSLCGIEKGKSCVPDCSKARRRRSLYKEADSSMITMAWRK